ncbi:MAG: cytochrome c [Bacteroidetes bacterium]|nr:cytochrome c [Bacteroidota bacterium]
MTNQASNGRLVWQKYNCQSCHQLYGLGGYLGPDLTNMCASPKKNEAFMKSILESGIRQMPSFALSNKEIKSLYAFLKDVNKTGVSDPRMFHSAGFGMIESNER